MKFEYQKKAEAARKCAEKMPFKTLDEAQAAGLYGQWQHGDARTKAYRCNICDRWHLASA